MPPLGVGVSAALKRIFSSPPQRKANHYEFTKEVNQRKANEFEFTKEVRLSVKKISERLAPLREKLFLSCGLKTFSEIVRLTTQ
jgi:hypothetical protein